MLRLLLPVLLLGWAGEACAQFWWDCSGPTWTSFTVGSYHFDRPNDYEERNLGIGVEKVCGDFRHVAGWVSRNSNRKPSAHIVEAWTPLSWRQLHGGVFAGFFTGYDKPLLPAGGFVGTWERRDYGLNLLWFPPYEDFEGLLVLQLKVLF